MLNLETSVWMFSNCSLLMYIPALKELEGSNDSVPSLFKLWWFCSESKERGREVSSLSWLPKADWGSFFLTTNLQTHLFLNSHWIFHVPSFSALVFCSCSLQFFFSHMFLMHGDKLVPQQVCFVLFCFPTWFNYILYYRAPNCYYSKCHNSKVLSWTIIYCFVFVFGLLGTYIQFWQWTEFKE